MTLLKSVKKNLLYEEAFLKLSVLLMKKVGVLGVKVEYTKLQSVDTWTDWHKINPQNNSDIPSFWVTCLCPSDRWT